MIKELNGVKTELEELKNVDRGLSTVVNGPIEMRVGNLPVQAKKLNIFALLNHVQKTVLASNSVGMCDLAWIMRLDNKAHVLERLN